MRSSNVLRGCICALTLFFFASCDDDQDPASPNGGEENIATDLTEPSAVIEAYAKALTKKNYDASEALLHDQFEFIPRASDLENFDCDCPWMPTTDAWSRTTELGLLFHMFDPNFGREGVHPVQTIRFHPTILDTRPLAPDMFEVTCSCQGQVLTGDDDGWFFDTMLVFEMVPVEGFLRIIRIEEREMLRPGGTREVESASWGLIKWGYR